MAAGKRSVATHAGAEANTRACGMHHAQHGLSECSINVAFT